ncbi:hypothetical protein SAMN05216360_108268 [Methylobacterium phyllostachyos]|uniref:Uncharacterized protein n=1 Tax=Methylobacterium phyllostachyos TaxID=582672 RepID=A0A1H0BRI0_9HYPH|nr:hypothetical protein [Methylobacterium phyllostachyos]SDN48185.1 hypothetical protein SAMN05216360_108268 [Methylobacterium phyllostachyos]
MSGVAIRQARPIFATAFTRAKEISLRASVLAILAALIAPVATAQAGDATLASEGNWDLKRSSGSATSEAGCVLTPKTQSRIQVSKDRLVVTGLPKNSIFNYQYRIDDKPASTPAIPSSAMQNDGIIAFDGDALAEILNGHRFQIRILDRWHEAITDDVDLSGLKDLHEKLVQVCNERPHAVRIPPT